jgi:hypothetical protein
VARIPILVGFLLAFASASFAATTTTAPGEHVHVYFVIDDKTIRYEILRDTAGGGNDFQFLEKYVLRGDVATFVIVNRGKKQHDFDFYGHRYKSLKPGKRVHFTAPLLRRGSFPYASTGRAKGYRGVFPVR